MHAGELFQATRGAIQAVTVGASPFTYTAPENGSVIVSSGTVSLITIVRGSNIVGVGATGGMFPVSIGDGIRITYSVAPNVRFVPA